MSLQVVCSYQSAATELLLRSILTFVFSQAIISFLTASAVLPVISCALRTPANEAANSIDKKILRLAVPLLFVESYPIRNFRFQLYLCAKPYRGRFSPVNPCSALARTLLSDSSSADPRSQK